MARPSVLVALIVALLAALTALQYRWIGELSQYQRQSMERTLRASTDRFARDLERELERLYYVFSVRGSRRAGEEIAQDYAGWLESSDFPQMVASAYWIRRDRHDDAAEELSVEEILINEGRLVPVAWPTAIDELREPLVASAEAHDRRDFHQSDSFTKTLSDGSIAFVVAQTRVDTKSWVVALLRREVFNDELIGGLVRHHFGADETREYDVRMVDSAQAERPLYLSTAGATATKPADYTRRMRDFGGVFVAGENNDQRTLTVSATHRAGSVDTAVARLRQRNLAFSFGVVLVLAASVGILGIAARRSRRLARRQMEFVAGVSHELRTPIAGISSLSQNLADGVVKDLDHAARYGETIYKESRRLGNMVEGVLQFSAIRSGRYNYTTHEVDLAAVIEDAVETLDPRQLARTRLATDIQAGLPPVRGDERALRSMVRNLASNALKFSRDGGEARVVATCIRRRGGDEIELRVEDNGPGIDAAERAQIFKPFFRGEAAQEQQIEGSGLGLSLVKDIVDAHSGRIEVSSEAGRGSVFRVYLPIAAATERHAATDADEQQLPADGLRPAGGGSEAT